MAAPVIPIFNVGDYETQVRRASDLLKASSLVVLPTETLYGTAAALTDRAAMQKLRDLRGGDASRPFVLHLADRQDATKFIGPQGEFASRLMKKLWPGPVGLIFDVPEERRSAVASELGVSPTDLYDGSTITLRCPDHIVAIDVIREVNTPVVLTAAGGAVGSSTDPVAIAESLDGKVDLIFDAGPPRYNKPSTILRVYDDHYEIVRPGVFDERIIERLLRTTVLFVCSGNTCRSPMAEALAKQILGAKLHVAPTELESKGISVLSAGSFAMPGARATPAAVEAVRGLGADLSRHRSRPLSVELIHQADVIFTMGRSHAQAVAALVPSASEKTGTLDPDKDIDDPIGGNVELYKNLAAELQVLIESRLSEKLNVQ